MHDGSCEVKGRDFYRCAICNFIVADRKLMGQHMLVHKDRGIGIHAIVDQNKEPLDQLEELAKSTTVEMTESPTKSLHGESPSKSVHSESPTKSMHGESPARSSHSESTNDIDHPKDILYFCPECPARFLLEKEVTVHRKFHSLQLEFKCGLCSYTARQEAHLLAHQKVHGEEYWDRTKAVLRSHLIAEAYQPWAGIKDRIQGLEDKLGFEKKATEVVPPFKIKSSEVWYTCSDCPSKFNKYKPYMHHRKFHGSEMRFKCNHCNYAVGGMGHLVRHKLVHGEKPDPEHEQKEADKQLSVMDARNVVYDDIALIGNKDFFYPTQLKNGKLKSKRYKCPKCPTAMDKRDQYLIHVRLHGANNKYTCKICDYSVKYYTNFQQHKSRHKWHEEVRRKKLELEPKDFVDETEFEPIVSNVVQDEELDMPLTPSKKKEKEKQQSECSKLAGLTLVEQQQLLLHELRENAGIFLPPDDQVFRCTQCPYTCIKKSAFEVHNHRHDVRGTDYYFCPYCDYKGYKIHTIKEHMKIHFRHSSAPKADVYMNFDKVEIWANTVNHNVNSDSENKDVKDEEKQAKPHLKQELVFTYDKSEEKEEPKEEVKDEDEKDEPYAIINYKTGEIVGGMSFAEYGKLSSLDSNKSPKKKSKIAKLAGENLDIPKSVLKNHQSIVGCGFCPMLFYIPSRLTRHLEFHGSNNKYTCPECNYSVSKNSSLTRHSKFHTKKYLKIREKMEAQGIPILTAPKDGAKVEAMDVAPAQESDEDDKE